MPLDYHLSPDSPLLQPGVFERLTHRLEYSHEKKIRSLMQVDEYLSLLSFPGVVWFVSKHAGLEPKQAAVAILSGMPWPLWNGDERQRLLLSVSATQAQLLKKLFRLRKGDLSIVLPWDEPLSPFSKNVEELRNSGNTIGRDFALRKNRADRSITELAQKTRQDEKLIRLTILALRTYIECLDSGWLHRASSQPKYSPPFLAHLWCGVVVRHYTILADYAEFSHIALTHEQVPRLFRQVYLFYDFLWCDILLPTRIRETGTIGEGRSQEYIKAFRIKVTDTLPQENLPFRSPEDSNTFYHHDETKEDRDFYRHGKLGNPCHKKDFAKILNRLGIERDGSPLELTAKLHFRTCQILDSSHKLSSKEMDRWWKLQSKLADQHIDKVLTKVIPVP